jgi:hypothetical protein
VTTWRVDPSTKTRRAPLVGWFETEKWDPKDGRRRAVPKMSIDDVRVKLEGQAASLPEGIIVRPVVVECRAPS